MTSAHTHTHWPIQPPLNIYQLLNTGADLFITLPAFHKALDKTRFPRSVGCIDWKVCCFFFFFLCHSQTWKWNLQYLALSKDCSMSFGWLENKHKQRPRDRRDHPTHHKQRHHCQSSAHWGHAINVAFLTFSGLFHGIVCLFSVLFYVFQIIILGLLSHRSDHGAVAFTVSRIDGTE